MNNNVKNHKYGVCVVKCSMGYLITVYTVCKKKLSHYTSSNRQ